MPALVIQLARFGDLVQTGRLLHTLLARGPTHLCVDQGLADLARSLYPKAIVHALPVHSRNTAHLAALPDVMQALAALPFNAVYNCNYAGMNRALARLFAPEIQHGYCMYGPQIVRNVWIRRAFRWTAQRAIAPLNLVDYWAFFAHNPLAPESTHPVAQGQGRGLGVALAGREARRSLPPALLGPLVRAAFEALGGMQIYFFGSTAEAGLARELRRHLPAHVVQHTHDLCGKTSLTDISEALVGLDALLTPDTGIMHLAARLGVPVRAFFLSSAWCHETGPYGLGHEVWQAMPACAPCLESAACAKSSLCRDPFMGRDMLRSFVTSLQGKQNAHTLPEGMVHYTAQLDALGHTWTCVGGHDPYAQARRALRALVAQSQGVFLDIPAEANVPALTDIVYDESDWILPATLGGYTYAR